ncbi:hypothetical protein AAG906_018292 [Vitis piasezkii]
MKATMVERKRGVSSWVKLGPVSLGLFLECLILCLEEKSEEKWERRWEENGRSYSLVRDANKGGFYLRLSVVDLESKRFSIFIPKGRGVKGGWSLMAKTLRSLGVVMDRKERQQVDARLPEPDLRKSSAEVEQTQRSKGKAVAKVKIRKEALSSNLNKLTHCLVGFWNPNSVRGDDLKDWGTQMASMWGLRGKLGLAKLERGKILLEFERLDEARKALKWEKWSPETGCVMEGETRSEAWVRIVGLPVSLWDRDILKRVGEECGGFLAVDTQTEKLEELQWARLLVKVNGDVFPSAVEIWVDERCYVLTLWWEIRPLLRIFPSVQSGKKVAVDVEVGGESVTRAGKRVMEEGNDPSYEVMIKAAELQRQSSGSGRPLGSFGAMMGCPSHFSVAGPSSYGLCTRMDHGQPKVSGLNEDIGLERGQMHSGPGGKAQVGEASPLVGVDSIFVGRPVSESSIFWEKDGLRKKIEKESQAVEKSKTDLALIEEATREYYDYSGAVCEVDRETPLCMLNAWVSRRVNCFLVSGAELRPAQSKPHEGRDWEEATGRKAIWLDSRTFGELRRLECSINYEGGKRRWWQGRGCQILEVL